MIGANGCDRPTLRLMYACGPGDVVTSYRHWKAGEELLSETSRTYTGQFFELCAKYEHAGYAVSSSGPPELLQDGAISVENRPKPGEGSGIRHHLSQLRYAGSLMATALRWRADVVIVSSGTTHWAFLSPLKLCGISIVGALHNSPWPKGHKPSRWTRRAILATEAWFWRRIASAVVSVSPECERQIRELAGDGRLIAVQHRAQFRRVDFERVCPPPPITQSPLRVLFAGRIERSKGALDVLEMARTLEKERPGRVQFDICGDGPALPDLRAAISKEGIHNVRTHGHLARPDLLKVYGESHVVVIPTRSDFSEGMPKVGAQAILCGRPVITSHLSNAEDVLPGALLLAAPDDPQSYVAAIRRLLDEPRLYESLCAACSPLQAQFYDPQHSLTAALQTTLGLLSTDIKSPRQRSKQKVLVD